ncbi:hypothetical protein MCETE7_00249 [Acidimicrobiia bacterium]
MSGTVRVEPDASGALRVIKTGVGSAANAVREEASVLNRARGPGVVAIVASSEIPEGFELSTAWVSYRSLSDIRRPTSVNRAAGLCLAIGATLQRIHAAGVAHNRLDPARVLLDESGRPTICGFRGASIDKRTFGRDIAALVGLTLWLLDTPRSSEPVHSGSRSGHWLQRRRLLTYLRSLVDRSDEQLPPLEEILEMIRRLAPGASLGLGLETDTKTARTSPWRRRTSIAVLVITIAAGVIALSNQRTPEPTAVVAAQATAPLETPVVTIGASRYRVGKPGDTAIALAPDCRNQMLIYLFRPETETLYVFESFATPGVDTYPTQSPVTGVVEMEADIDPFTGCDALAVTFTDGHREHVTRPETP